MCLKRAHPPRTIIKRKEMKSIKELREDDIRMILTVDEGVALEVIDKENYIEGRKPAEPTHLQADTC